MAQERWAAQRARIADSVRLSHAEELKRSTFLCDFE